MEGSRFELEGTRIQGRAVPIAQVDPVREVVDAGRIPSLVAIAPAAAAEFAVTASDDR
jgi:hypothetical protein